MNSPLLETTIGGATGVILNIVGGPDLTLDEVTKAAGLIHGVVDYSANIIFGACVDENVQDEVEVTVIATGFRSAEPPDVVRAAFMGQQPAEQPEPSPSANELYGSLASPYAQQPAEAPVQPAPAPQPEQPVYEASSPYGQAQTYRQPVYNVPPQPMQQPQQPVYQQPVQQTPPQPEPQPEPEDDRDRRLPPFVRRMLGRK